MPSGSSASPGSATSSSSFSSSWWHCKRPTDLRDSIRVRLASPKGQTGWYRRRGGSIY